jgi:hypothetical protein
MAAKWNIPIPPVPGPERPSITDAEYVDAIRAFPPSKFIPAICEVTAQFETGEWAHEFGKQTVTVWALADMARVSLAHSNETRSKIPTQYDVLRCAANYMAISDPDLMEGGPGSFERFFLRIAGEQLVWQTSPFMELSRTTALWETPPARPLKVMKPGWDIDLLGCTLSDYRLLGEFVFSVSASHHGHFNEAIFAMPEMQRVLGTLTPDQASAVYRQHFLQTPDDFRTLVGKNNRPAPYRRMTYNPLADKPVIRCGGPDDYVPIPLLMMRKVTPLGLYYTGIKRWGNDFSTELGYIFEPYLGRHLKHCRGADVYPEIKYGPPATRRDSVDFIVVTPKAVVLIDAKSIRPTESVRTGDDRAADELKRMLRKGVDQLEETEAAIASGVAEFAHIPTDRPRVGLLVTITDFNVATNAPIRTFAGLESDFPYVIASMGDIEQAVVHADDFGEIVLKAALADPWTGNTLRSQFVADGRIDNPILDAAWENSLTSARLDAAAASEAASGG